MKFSYDAQTNTAYISILDRRGSSKHAQISDDLKIYYRSKNDGSRIVLGIEIQQFFAFHSFATLKQGLLDFRCPQAFVHAAISLIETNLHKEEKAVLGDTPKRTAQDLIATRLSETVCYLEDLLKATGEWQKMSPKEREQVQEQVKKVADRAIKACGYAETWQC